MGVKAALRAGADPNVTDEDMRSSAMHQAAIAGSSILLYHLLKAGGRALRFNNFHSTPLHRAVDKLSESAVEQLIWGGGTDLLEASDHSGHTPFDLLREKYSRFEGQPATQARMSRLIATMTRLQSSPEVSDWGTVSHSELLTPTGKRHFALLDYPECWHHFDALVQGLEMQGTPLTKQDLLRPSHSGEPFIVNGCKALQWTKICRYLNRQGQGWTAQDFITPAGEPTPLLQFFQENLAVDDVFQQEIWRGQPASAIRKVYAALGAFDQSQVSNLHGLIASAQRPHAQARGVA